jgi:hypothetical protein
MELASRAQREICMTETPEELRRRIDEADSRFYEQMNKRSEPHHGRSFEYEKLAVEYSNKGLQLLTYLNGGALVAIPTALAFFKADIGKTDVLWTATAFVVGLFFVVLAQAAAFFTMARRAEASTYFAREQFQRVAALQFHHQSIQFLERMSDAQSDRLDGLKRTSRSNVWRLLGIVFFAISLIAFATGCVYGLTAVLLAKEVASRL